MKFTILVEIISLHYFIHFIIEMSIGKGKYFCKIVKFNKLDLVPNAPSKRVIKYTIYDPLTTEMQHITFE